MDLVVCLALYSYSDILEFKHIAQKHDNLLFPSNRTFPCFDSRVVYVNNGLGFVVRVCSFLYLQDGRHLNEMTTSLLVEIELDDQGSRVQYIQSNASFPSWSTIAQNSLCIFKEKTLPENVVAAKSAAKFLCRQHS